ncbi:ethanolamine ammonia-lyase subunit EutC [Polaromonas sp.]|uniref:ethanolamine ammonia-lyase subunit EutC n=1 Tax=Polaromonas sp. TaxID=1869339 RepID=UPI002731D286|nr:ethanolamine ammonia-lyase subunit EutC [Polaromonas sp.]MDP1741857.1 ethanolamine ammonia-lyase subunit EutC [Polaromonas sp.]
MKPVPAPVPTSVIDNPWQQLRQFTAARIALGRSGVSLPTQPQLAFQLAHARARDAVHLALDVPQLLQELESAGLTQAGEALVLESAAADRLQYLQRPDLGRRLSDASRGRLKAFPDEAMAHGFDLAVVVADGLSALAVAQQAVPLLRALQPHLSAAQWSLAPLVIVRQGRVAVGDEIGQLLGARALLLLIGERPGLSSPDSLGAYLSWMPRVGLTDASRNCISNIRPMGLSCEEAAIKVHYLISEMQRRQLSGVLLKDESSADSGLPGKTARGNFLLAGPS